MTTNSHSHRRPRLTQPVVNEVRVVETVAPFRVYRVTSTYDKVELFHCCSCRWVSAMRDQGGGFSTFEQWYSPLAEIVFTIPGNWRDELTEGLVRLPDGSQTQGPTERALAIRDLFNRKELIVFDRVSCPRCHARFQAEHYSKRDARSSSPDGGPWLSERWYEWWNRLLRVDARSKTLFRYEARFRRRRSGTESRARNAGTS
jgi:hypothetical protein